MGSSIRANARFGVVYVTAVPISWIRPPPPSTFTSFTRGAFSTRENKEFGCTNEEDFGGERETRKRERRGSVFVFAISR